MAPGLNSYRIRTPLHDARQRRLASTLERRFVLRRLAVSVSLTVIGASLIYIADNWWEAPLGLLCLVLAALMFREATR
jgi:1,4-dihydroxy-2-naphthoate octaprenyltransferase